MKICLFGGTFDPPHIAHLIIAESILNILKVDKILFIPASLPPHKPASSFSPLNARVDMLRLAIRNNPSFQMSEIEIRQPGISYSIDTIKKIKKEMGLERENLYFAIGSDSLLNLHTWKDPMGILSLSTVVVIPRRSFEKEKVDKKYLQYVQFLDLPVIDISSSMIRDMVRRGKSIKYLVTDEVLEYIQKNKLYCAEE